ncbi:uncharacterized protein LOC132746619 isoform X2 [Ruditapes philippinarum]|uniref:uncharacterized protein LOC132746619 isoform X2 n=1 Tax=Ruditapes philippinarum TaxID=129788 RepID=UPI00295AA84C|nr:uncharacterized protein LOC132746619 isoform X2 [Ruditapes philippinarum]
MAGKNERSATLPSNLRHSVAHAEEKEGLFTKLKKKFRLKKGRYHVDVSTGECENISAVSFKKRQSREVLEDESPWKLRDPASESQDSLKLSELTLGKPGDKQHLALKGKERKLSNPETYTRSLTSSEINSFQRSSFDAKAKGKSTNEYSPLTYDTKENVTDRSLKIRESTLTNDCVLHDDSAIDLDTDVEHIRKSVGNNIGIVNIDTGFDPGYEKLPEKRPSSSREGTCVTPGSDFDPNYESVQDVKDKIKGKTDLEFDPNYESVDEAKAKSKSEQLETDECWYIDNDPGYQSVKDVKRETTETVNKGIRPPKTYSKNQSIESLDEPGYESLNDVKKRIAEQNFTKSGCKTITKSEERTGTRTDGFSLSSSETDEYFNDSAIGSVPKSESLPQMEVRERRSVSGEAVLTQLESERGLQAFAEAVVSLTGVATALTASGTSKDSGFESKDRSLDSEQAENLYSSVNKTKRDDDETPYSSVNKEKKLSTVDQPETGDKHVAGPGVIPYSIYSEGSGSKMSSCTSLDLSAEDFALEPGYAECADAIKSGAIKKISVSHERLVEQTVGHKHEDKVKGEISSEIYANPQILFRKRSKLIEDSNEENAAADNKNVEESKEKTKLVGEEICLAVNKSGKKKEKKSKKAKVVKDIPPEAPPLPARNYSLYLDGEEAEQVVQEVLQDCEKGIDIDASSLDDAFATEETSTNQSAGDKLCKEIKQLGTDKTEKVSSVEKNLEENDKESDGKDAEPTDNESEKEKQDILDITKENDQAVKHDLTVYSVESENVTPNTDVLNKSCNNYISSNCCDETHGNSSVNVETEGEENCLHVVVKDESGAERVLKVVEKQESFHLQRRRESSRKKVNNCAPPCDEKNGLEDKKILINSDNSSGYSYKEGLSHTKEGEILKPFSTNFTSANCTDLLNTKDNIDHVCGVECNKDKKDVKEGCAFISETTKSDPSLKVSQTDHTFANIVDNIASENGNINAYHSNYSDTSNKRDSSEVENSNFLTVAVKMKCISVDSDSDFINTEDLPKLEISESDLESPFDSSDNSNHVDIETESAGIDKLTQRIKTEDEISHCSDSSKFKEESAKLKEDSSNLVEDTRAEIGSAEILCLDSTGQTCKEVDVSVENANVEDKSSEKTICSLFAVETNKPLCSNGLVNRADLSVSEENGVINTYQHKGDDVVDGIEGQSSDRKATLESRLCVIESEKESESDLSKLIDDLNDEVVVARVDPELSDDSAIGNIDDFQQVENLNHNEVTNSESDTDASQDKNNSNDFANSSTENVTSKELHLIYEKQHPNLYEDSEPTHMSLEEALGLSPSNPVTRSHSDSSGHSLLFTASPNAFIHSNIPNIQFENQSELTVTPPPRPPPIASSSQLESRICVTDQSGEVGKAVTPIDEVPSPFSLSYMRTDQSEEEAPPAIPPRHRTPRTPGRPVSYSQDFMESMRQLKDCGWYWGPLSWEEAEHKLGKSPEGTFLVRDSSDEHYILSLSFKNQGRVHHTRIEHHKGHFSFWSQPDSHGKSTIKEFIEQCVENSRNGRFLYFIRPSGPGSPPMPIQLLNPVSRFKQMRSLQHMCRFRILQLARRDHIDHLPIPTRIKQYLKEAQYYVESLDD